MRRLKLELYVVRGPDEQPQEMVAGNMGSQSHSCRELVVTGRPIDQGHVAAVGKSRRRIGDRAEHNGLVSAFDQDIGHYFGKRAAP